jgi:hypothetical protein
VDIEASAPASVIAIAALPPSHYPDPYEAPVRTPRPRPRSPLSEEEMKALEAEAMLLPEQPGIAGAVMPTELIAGVSFPALNYAEVPGSTPPDPELAVGPGHVIAVVNTSFRIYSKTGAPLGAPIAFNTFFTGTPGFPGGSFDPVASYDESRDRFVIGTDANGSAFCLAATTGPDPTATWNRYCFATNVGGAFFDYPHMGIGEEGVFVGSNQFNPGFIEGRVFAVNKANLYAGSPLGTVPSFTTTNQHSTPWPASIHGFAQGNWPTGTNRHYIVTETFNGCTHNIWTWTDPFGAGASFVRGAAINLCTATGVTAGFPVNWPQNGAGTMQANDYRTQSVRERHGSVWTAQTIACNPGGGTVDCVRWAQLDPEVDSVVDAGVLGSSGEFRVFPSLAVNHCGDMVMGYSLGSASTFPATAVSGRLATDPPGVLQSEIVLKQGEKAYACFDSSPRRWGDYTGMAIDPDGRTFWYLGQYSRINSAACDWATYVGKFAFGECLPELFSNSFESLGSFIFADGFETPP